VFSLKYQVCVQVEEMDKEAVRVLACSGALEKISNAEEGMGIELAVKRMGLVREGKTQRTVLFVVYQNGRYGPQNGLRLALVKEGVRVEDARENLKGFVEHGLEEFVIVKPDELAEDGDTAGTSLNSR